MKRFCLICAALALIVLALAPPSARGQQAGSSGFSDKATGGWGGVRQRLEAEGITIEADSVLEGFINFRGGIRTNTLVAASTSDLSLGIDAGKLLGWSGAKFYMDLEDHGGRNPSKVLVGDLQIFDKQNTMPYLQIFELWYQQKLCNGRLRIKIGKVDANTEFSVVDNGLSFLNSSSQVSPTLFVFPTTPDPMPSANVFFTPCKFWYLSLGAYYANRSDRFGEIIDNPSAAQLTDFGTFLIGETGLKWGSAPFFPYAGNVRGGFWDHTGTFTRFDGSEQQGAYGGYAIFDQTLWQPPGEPADGRGVRAFLEYGRTQKTIDPIYQHIGGGVTWTGLFACRPEDIAGFSPQYAYLSSGAGLSFSYELALEAFYRFKVTPWATVQPDLQYIVHPGGKYPDALVATMSMKVDF
ncbi:MAG: carbohydrate porin [Syntrophobacteraceae bacterium]